MKDERFESIDRILAELASPAEPITAVQTRQAFKRLGSQGLFGPGLRGPHDYAALIQHGVESFRRVGSSGLPLGLAVGLAAHYSAFLAPLLLLDEPAEFEETIELATAGAIVGSHATTEQATGSRSYELRTETRLVGGTELLTGAKDWITNGLVADYALLQFRHLQSEGGMLGLSSALVDLHQPALQRTSYECDPLPGAWVAQLSFNDCEIHRHVGEPGQGAMIFTYAMDCERVVMYETIRAWAEAQLNGFLKHIKRSQRGEMRLATNDVIRNRLSRAHLDLQMAKTVVDEACEAAGSTPRFDGSSERVKIVVSQAVQRAVKDIVEIGGASRLFSGESTAILLQSLACLFMSGPDDVLLSNYSHHIGL